MSIGAERVRLDFNPSGNKEVNEIKQKSADLIDLCAKLQEKRAGSGEEKRLWALAMTHYEDAAMWAVKAATSDKTKT